MKMEHKSQINSFEKEGGEGDESEEEKARCRKVELDQEVSRAPLSSPTPGRGFPAKTLRIIILSKNTSI